MNRALDWTLQPLELAGLWPVDRPLACCISSGVASARSRWSIFAAPVGLFRHSGDGMTWETWDGGAESRTRSSDPVAALGEAIGSTAGMAQMDGPLHGVFAGGWLGWLSYDLGRQIEPRARHLGSGAAADRPWPLFELLRCPAAYVHDAIEDRWWSVGPESELPPIRIGRAGRLDEHSPIFGPVVGLEGAEAYADRVARILEMIRAGDVYQVNLAHRLTATFEGSMRMIARSLLERAGAWYGAYLESPVDPGGGRRAICSLSPELFLRLDADRRIETRPIKGTCAARDGAAVLELSAKDQAELVMITDLMRNDLGRVCRLGSMRVAEARAIERHGGRESGVYHGVSTVRGVLRDEIGIGDVLRATFPPGSVTGAPKIRAMQLIDELEPVRRGPYCGAIGYFSDCGAAQLNVAIRTALLSGHGQHEISSTGVIDYSVGAGIVADSTPESEWRETLQKAGVFLESVDAHQSADVIGT